MARGKGKRGGGRGSMRRFAAQSAEEIEQRNARLAEFDAKRAQRRKDAGVESDDDGDDEAGSGDDAGAGGADAEREAMLVGMRVASMNMGDGGDEGRKERKSKGLEGIIETENPNARASRGKMYKVGSAGAGEGQMTRREREEAEKAAAAESYRRRHEAGLTEEYKRDMAKLEEVRKRRAEAAAKAEAEEALENSLEEERRKKAAAVGAVDDSSSDDDEDGKKAKKKSSKKKDKEVKVPKLDKITIKKMKPTQLKEALKARELDIQGNAKALQARLLEYESKR